MVCFAIGEEVTPVRCLVYNMMVGKRREKVTARSPSPGCPQEHPGLGLSVPWAVTSPPQQFLKLPAIELLDLHQLLGKQLQLIVVLAEQCTRSFSTLVEDTLHLSVD